MDFEQYKKQIKSAFCELVSFRVLENALEIITPYSTLNNKFISVFLTFTNDKTVLTDDGWLHKNYYDTDIHDEYEEILERVTFSYQQKYGIKKTTDHYGITYHYKTCANLQGLPSAIFDFVNFMVGAVNAQCIHYKDEKDIKERDKFKGDANLFLKNFYQNRVKFRQPLDDLKNVKFNAIITKSTDVYLISYITGATPIYFENEVRKSIVNFELSLKSKYRNNIVERITLINNHSLGYQPSIASSIMGLLDEKMTRKPILWDEKEKIFDYI